jgi:hypothetical protein
MAVAATFAAAYLSTAFAFQLSSSLVSSALVYQFIQEACLVQHRRAGDAEGSQAPPR